MRTACWLAVCLGCLVACGDHHDGAEGDHHDDDDGQDEDTGEPTGASCPTDSKLTYQSFGQPFFAEYCVGCHAAKVKGDDRMNAPLDHNFETLDGIVDELEHIEVAAAGGPKAINTTMPPAGSKVPSEAERKQLGEWIACGTP